MNIESIGDFLASRSDLMIILWSDETGWRTVTPKCHFFDNELEEISIHSLQELVLEEDRQTYGVFLEKISSLKEGIWEGKATDENKVHTVVRMNIATGGYAYFGIDCWLEKNSDTVTGLMVMVYEADEEEMYRIRLARVVTNDRTPAVFMQQGRELVSRNPDKKYAMIQFDVAKFKMINEVYGESIGDEILNFFIDSLKIICSPEQLYVRLSADVFMILTDYEEVEDIYRFIDTLDENLLGYRDLKYTLVYGICLVENFQDGLRKYGDAAALARQSIKGNALRHVALFEDKMKEGILSRKYIEDNMKTALEKKEFVMYLQPKYSISQNRMVGAEALVRWIHPEKGMISPGDFVPLFEKNGFVVKMDQYIWEEACRTIRRWTDEGREVLPISVNVSRRHLKSLEFVSVLDNLIDKYQIPKKYLEIEITETVEEAEISEGVALLKKEGYTLLMDDFGSGYSSLNTLKDTRFDIIKIDRGFLQNFIGSERGQRIVEHTIKMSQDIGLDMVAEGVETEEQAAFLKKCGCDVAQGFYYAKPMCVDEFEKQMK